MKASFSLLVALMYYLICIAFCIDQFCKSIVKRSLFTDWSYPVQIPMEAADRQLGIAVPTSPYNTSHYLLTTHIVNGVTYILISDSYTPTVVIHNLCPFTVAYGQVGMCV